MVYGIYSSADVGKEKGQMKPDTMLVLGVIREN